MLVAGLVGIAAAANAIPAHASSPSWTWSAPALVDQHPWLGHAVALQAISCPGVTLCVAVDNAGDVFTSSQPTGGAGTWTGAHIETPVCNSPVPGGTCGGFTGISCPSTSLCVAVDIQGNVLVSRDPTGGANAWQAAQIDAFAGCSADGSTGSCSGLSGVACASASLCVAVDDFGNVFASSDPTGGASAWRAARVDNSGAICSPSIDCRGLTTPSCPSSSLCVAIDHQAKLIRSTNPTGGVSAWSTVTPNGLIQGQPGLPETALSCASTLLCVGLAVEVVASASPGTGSSGTITSTDPFRAGDPWVFTPAAGKAQDLDAVSCAPGTSLCAAADGGGDAAITSNPIGPHVTWTIRHVDGPDQIVAVSCASGALCVLADDAGQVVVGTGPPPPRPVNTGRPRLLGKSVRGAKLVATAGSWRHQPRVFIYRWQVCDRSGRHCTAIQGADSRSYTITRADIGKKIRVLLTTMNAGGTSTTVHSTPTHVVRAKRRRR